MLFNANHKPNQLIIVLWLKLELKRDLLHCHHCIKPFTAFSHQWRQGGNWPIWRITLKSRLVNNQLCIRSRILRAQFKEIRRWRWKCHSEMGLRSLLEMRTKTKRGWTDSFFLFRDSEKLTSCYSSINTFYCPMGADCDKEVLVENLKRPINEKDRWITSQNEEQGFKAQPSKKMKMETPFRSQIMERVNGKEGIRQLFNWWIT